MFEKQIDTFLKNSNVSFRNPYLDALKEIVCGLHPDCATEFQKFEGVKPDPTNRVLNVCLITDHNARRCFTRPWSVKWGAIAVGVVDAERESFDPATDDKMQWYASHGLTRKAVMGYVYSAIDRFVDSMMESTPVDDDAQAALVWLEKIKTPLKPAAETAEEEEEEREATPPPEKVNAKKDDSSSGSSGSGSSSSDDE